MKKKVFRTLGLSLLSVLVSEAVMADPKRFNEPGRLGSPESWKTTEFNGQWGLGAINAHHAYAQGYTGKGIAIGVVDSQVIANHPKLTGKHTDLSPGPYDHDHFEISGEDYYLFNDHGTHVAGIAAAKRDGTGNMHGVAFDATLVTASFKRDQDKLETMVQNNTRIINNSWGWKNYNNVAELNADLARLNKTEIERLSQLSIGSDNYADETESTMAGLLRAANHGKLIVFAAGNEGNHTIPGVLENLPLLFPNVLGNYLVVTNLTKEDVLNQDVNEIEVGSTRAGPTASFSVSAPGTDINSTSGEPVDRFNMDSIKKGTAKIVPGYQEHTGTSMAAPLVSGAAAVVMQRFPYMTAEQISAVLKTTATSLDGERISGKYGWGKINLKDAMGGPKMFITQQDIPEEFYINGSYTNEHFVATLGTDVIVDPNTPLARQCTGPECAQDTWSNNIGGHGGLKKLGNGTLTLTGNSTYQGTTLVEQGQLDVAGSVTSAVAVNGSGILGGNGTVGSLAVQQGGTVAPGLGRLSVSQNVAFDQGSRYRVTVAEGKNSLLHAATAQINGGEVTVTPDNSENLLTSKQVESLLDRNYTILSTDQGVSGEFTAVHPNYRFFGTKLNYQPDQVLLEMIRNSTTFASVANTDNERSVATALDHLQAGHAVFESLLRFNGNDQQIRQAYRQLSGQVHADVTSAQMHDSRMLRDTLNSRLRQAQGLGGDTELKADNHGAWAKLVGAWRRMAGDTNATGYQTSTYGILLGGDAATQNNSRLGIATGYTRTSLNGGYGAFAKTNNVPLALYGGANWGNLSLRAGAANTWHSIDTSRTVAYGTQSDRPTASYKASTRQLFTEMGYQIDNGLGFHVEPFANLAWVQTERNGFSEKGGAAALKGNRQKSDATFSTTGLRADKQWQANKTVTVGLHAELGWQHTFGNVKQSANLKFNDAAAFSINSTAASRDSALVKVGTQVNVSENTALTLGYSGQLSSNNQDNSINAGFDWRF